jgi:hypothetical protein
MPNYPTHARWGQIGAAAIGSAVAAAIYLLVLSPVLAFVAGIGAAATTFVGAIYPDIDHHKSIPRRKAVRAFQILVVLGIASLAGLGWVEVVETVEIASTEFGVELPMPAEIVAVLALAGLAAIAASLINPVIGIIWLLTHQLTFERRLTAVIVTGTFFVGTLIHLGLDGEIV